MSFCDRIFKVYLIVQNLSFFKNKQNIQIFNCVTCLFSYQIKDSLFNRPRRSKIPIFLSTSLFAGKNIQNPVSTMTPVAAGVPLLILLLSLIAVSAARSGPDDVIKLPSEASRFFRPAENDDDSSSGTRWAVLVAGSSGYWNYRHQVLFFSL